MSKHKKKTTYGYHSITIPKGEYGKISKIQEELIELVDAEQQGIRVMVYCELCDVYGALEAYALTQGLSMLDLKKMSDSTRNAFKTGRRT